MARFSGTYAMALWLPFAWIATTNSFFFDCPPCEFVQCAPIPATCSNTSIYYDDCGCCAICARNKGERCGGRLNSGGDCAPGLRCAYRLGSIYGEEREGICEDELCTRHECNYRKRCVVEERFGIQCRCPTYRCQGKSNQVCGNDGNTYSSVCELQKAECYDSKFIGIAHFGRCPVTAPPPSTAATKTNAVPTPDDELFQQMYPTPDSTEDPTGCVYMSQKYGLNEMAQLDSRDPCRYLICNAEGILAEVWVPGCQGGPPEMDYGVTRPPVHGGWSSWSTWSDCEGSCFNATKTRSHICTNPAPRYEGRYCVGVDTDVARCLSSTCEVDNTTCLYSDWSVWSACSETCGTGTRVRSRTLLHEVVDESTCVLQETESCMLEECIEARCRGWRREQYLVSGSCQTVNKHTVKYCEGRCDQGGCCGPVNVRTRTFPVQCEGHISYRDMPFEVPTSCGCQACDDQSGEGTDIGT